MLTAATTPAIDIPGCDVPGIQIVTGMLCPATDAVNGVGTAVSWATDPVGSLSSVLQGAATSLTSAVLPVLQKVSSPKLDADWFLETYRVAFSISLIVFVLIVLWSLVQFVKGDVSGDQLWKSLTFYGPLYLIGCMFGPAIGMLLVDFFATLGQAVASKLFGQTMDETTANMVRIATEVGQGRELEAGDRVQTAGGAIVSAFLLLLFVLALLVLLIVLIVMQVTLYLTGVLVPLSLVWLTHPLRREKGMRLVATWVGILASQVLLFLMITAAFRMAAGMVMNWDATPALEIVINCLVAVVAVFLAVATPFLLAKFGSAVLPTTGPSRGEVPMPSRDKPIGQQGAPSKGDSQIAQMSRAGSGSGGGGGGGSPLPSLGGGKAAPPGVSSMGAGGGGGGTGLGARPPVPAGASAGGGAMAGGGAAAGGAAAGSGAAAGGATAGVAAGGAAATAGTGGLAAPLAVAATVAAGAVEGGKKLASVTADLSRKTGEAAADELGHHQDLPYGHRG